MPFRPGAAASNTPPASLLPTAVPFASAVSVCAHLGRILPGLLGLSAVTWLHPWQRRQLLGCGGRGLRLRCLAAMCRQDCAGAASPAFGAFDRLLLIWRLPVRHERSAFAVAAVVSHCWCTASLSGRVSAGRLSPRAVGFATWQVRWRCCLQDGIGCMLDACGSLLQLVGLSDSRRAFVNMRSAPPWHCC